MLGPAIRLALPAERSYFFQPRRLRPIWLPNANNDRRDNGVTTYVEHCIDLLPVGAALLILPAAFIVIMGPAVLWFVGRH